MIIAIDIGNSSISIGYFGSKGLIVQKIPTHPMKSPLEYRKLMHEFIRENNIEKGRGAGIISSVVAGHTENLKEALEGLSGPGSSDVVIVSHALSGIGLRIPHPEELGTDRIANAVAAFSLMRKPVIAVDFGTATTITVVDGNGDYRGGSILPGIGLMNEALGMKTSRLRKVDVAPPENSLGKDTTGCILSGLVIGTAGAVERIVSEIENETGVSYDVILTGGFSPLMDPFIRRSHTVRTDLTLEGLKILYEKNRPQ
jgi:type III pantothenate kinase